MSHILTHENGSLLELEICRESKKNALTEAMYIDLAELLTKADSDDSVSALLIYGQPHCFTAGNDLADFYDNPPQLLEAPVFRFLRVMAAFSKPIVLAINGPAVGIGTTMCFHADIICCGDNVRFQMPFAHLGLVPEFASSYLLPRLAGPAKAFELLVLGEPFDGNEALRIGLVNGVYDDENYLNAARHKALAITRLPREAVRSSKALIRSHTSDKVRQAIDNEGAEFIERLHSQEAREKLAAILKR